MTHSDSDPSILASDWSSASCSALSGLPSSSSDDSSISFDSSSSASLASTSASSSPLGTVRPTDPQQSGKTLKSDTQSPSSSLPSVLGSSSHSASPRGKEIGGDDEVEDTPPSTSLRSSSSRGDDRSRAQPPQPHRGAGVQTHDEPVGPSARLPSPWGVPSSPAPTVSSPPTSGTRSHSPSGDSMNGAVRCHVPPNQANRTTSEFAAQTDDVGLNTASPFEFDRDTHQTPKATALKGGQINDDVGSAVAEALPCRSHASAGSSSLVSRILLGAPADALTPGKLAAVVRRRVSSAPRVGGEEVSFDKIIRSCDWELRELPSVSLLRSVNGPSQSLVTNVQTTRTPYMYDDDPFVTTRTPPHEGRPVMSSTLGSRAASGRESSSSGGRGEQFREVGPPNAPHSDSLGPASALGGGVLDGSRQPPVVGRLAEAFVHASEVVRMARSIGCGVRVVPKLTNVDCQGRDDRTTVKYVVYRRPSSVIRPHVAESSSDTRTLSDGDWHQSIKSQDAFAFWSARVVAAVHAARSSAVGKERFVDNLRYTTCRDCLPFGDPFAPSDDEGVGSFSSAAAGEEDAVVAIDPCALREDTIGSGSDIPLEGTWFPPMTTPAAEVPWPARETSATVGRFPDGVGASGHQIQSARQAVANARRIANFASSNETAVHGASRFLCKHAAQEGSPVGSGHRAEAAYHISEVLSRAWGRASALASPVGGGGHPLTESGSGGVVRSEPTTSPAQVCATALATSSSGRMRALVAATEKLSNVLASNEGSSVCGCSSPTASHLSTRSKSTVGRTSVALLRVVSAVLSMPSEAHPPSGQDTPGDAFGTLRGSATGSHCRGSALVGLSIVSHPSETPSEEVVPCHDDVCVNRPGHPRSVGLSGASMSLRHPLGERTCTRSDFDDLLAPVPSPRPARARIPSRSGGCEIVDRSRPGGPRATLVNPPSA